LVVQNDEPATIFSRIDCGAYPDKSKETLPRVAIDPKTWRELFEAVYEMNSAGTYEDFGAVVAGLSRLIVAEVTVFQVLDRTTQRIMTRMSPSDPFTAEEIAYYTTHSGEMPLVAHYARETDPQARRISDVIDHHVWLASDYYRACLARLAAPYCVALPITVDASTVVAISFNRGSADFTRRDCELLDAFAPHFRLAWERHEDPWGERREIAARQRLQALGLSPRESEVLFWMTEGKQNREIATILGISLGTVQEYVAGILAKLKQENRHAATVFAISKLRVR
jgi:DNA-binding CsgD family transcriptional regulator